MTRTIEADICIIGAGSGGLSVAAGAAQLGRSVVLIEKGEMGGDCLNYGCIPSKALIAAAARAHLIRTPSKFGVSASEPVIDFPAVMDHVKNVIAEIAPMDSQERFEGFGVTVLREEAIFNGPRTVMAGDTRVEAKHIVIATGSSPFVPPIDGIDDTPYLTNENLFDNRTLPDHLIVIGGGPIGLEMAQAHRRLGAKVTVIEAMRVLGKDDPELTTVVKEALIAEGVEIIEDMGAKKVMKRDEGVSVELADGRQIDGSHLLMAVGRRANVDGLNLEAAGVEYSRKGIKVNARLQTSNKRIYAIGDVAGGRQFTHVAGYHAGLIIKNILFKAPSKNREDLAPAATYCDPELASIGMTEDEARKSHGDIKVVRWPFAENDRAQAERRLDGLVKVVTDKKGKILGAGIVGKDAGDLIGPYALAMANGLKINAFTNMIAPYPTRSEAAKRAAGAWYTPTLFSDRTRKLVRLLSTFD